MLNLDFLHDNEFTGDGINMAVIDAGFVNVNSMSSFSRLRDSGGILYTYDFVLDTENIYEYQGNSHGTKVLSTIAGFVEDEYYGTAPDASFYLFRTEDVSSETPVEECYWVEAVEVPTEQVTEVRRGKKIKAERKFFPGYVLAKLNMNDDVYHLVKNTPKVTGFLGAGNKPQPITEAEAARILNTKQELEAAPKKRVSVDYEIGDQVKVLGGPFASFNGLVEELDFDKNRVKVSVSIFGRATPVELDFEEVELIK